MIKFDLYLTYPIPLPSLLTPKAIPLPLFYPIYNDDKITKLIKMVSNSIEQKNGISAEIPDGILICYGRLTFQDSLTNW